MPKGIRMIQYNNQLQSGGDAFNHMFLAPGIGMTHEFEDEETLTRPPSIYRKKVKLKCI